MMTSRISTAQVPDAVGTWMFHCHVNEHLNAGMRTLYRVDGEDNQEAPGTVREYFIQVRGLSFVELCLSRFKNEGKQPVYTLTPSADGVWLLLVPSLWPFLTCLQWALI